MDINKTFSDIAQYRMLKAQAEAELDRLEAEVKDFMTSQGMEELIGDEHKALYKAVTSNRVDTTRLKKELPQVAEQFTKATTSMRFTFA